MASRKKQMTRTMSAWRQMMTSLYPDLLSSTICVPPVIVNRVPYTRDTIAGQPILVVQQPSDTSPSPISPPPVPSPPVPSPPVSPPPPVSSMGLPVVSTSLPPAVQALVARYFAFLYSSFYNYMFEPESDAGAADMNQKSDVSQSTPAVCAVQDNTTTTSTHDEGFTQSTTLACSGIDSALAEPVQNLNSSSMSTQGAEPEKQAAKMALVTDQSSESACGQSKTNCSPLAGISNSSSSSSSSAAQSSHNAFTVQGKGLLQVSPTIHRDQSQTSAVSNNSKLMDQSTPQAQTEIPAISRNSSSSSTAQNQSQNQPQSKSPNMSSSQSPSQLQNQPRSQSQTGSQNQSHSQPQNQPQNPSPSFSMWTPDPSPHTTPDTVWSSDVRDDFAQQYLLTNLQALGNAGQEAMFILSQLNFTSYLKDLSSPAKPKWFPRPIDLTKQLSEGDFDVLIIHRHYGILIGEIKSVGMNLGQLKKTPSQRDADVSKRIWRAVKQLDKSEQVVNHLVSDIAPGLMVRKTAMLPFVSSDQLLSILSKDAALNQAICQCLGAANETEATALCVCSDQLSDPSAPWKVTKAGLSHLSTWWQHRMACTTDNSLTDQMYLDIVARFAGPATSVTVQCTVPPRLQIRTQGEAVSFLGDTFARLILTPEQVDLLNRAPPRVYLKGPPGTGKTVTLVLMGLRWVLEGHDVYVCSQSFETRAVAELICHQIETTAALHVKSASPSFSVGKVHLLAYDMTVYNLEEGKKMMLDFAKLACKGGPHRFILDEIMLGKGSALIDLWQTNILFWILEMFLLKHHVWMAGVTNNAMPPSFHEAAFSTPLRSAPAIQREVQAGLDRWAMCGAAIRYLTNAIPAPTDGLTVIRLQHHGAGHSPGGPVDCEQCGLTIADLLQRQLHVGRPAYQRASKTSKQATVSSYPAPLQYKDVFIVTRSSDLRDDVTDDAGKVVTSASGVVRGLRLRGVPLFVLGVSTPLNRWKCQGIVSGMGLTSFDRVVVSFSTFLQGLERKIVVWLPGENHRKTEEYLVEFSEILDRVHALSRCTTQLVMVEIPEPLEPDLD